MSWEEVCHWIAQGCVNISYGHTTIEENSKVHMAMKAFCDYVHDGFIQRVVPTALPKKVK